MSKDYNPIPVFYKNVDITIGAGPTPDWRDVPVTCYIMYWPNLYAYGITLTVGDN